MIPDSARRELYAVQLVCAGLDINRQPHGSTYIDHIWAMRYPDTAPKPSMNWPFQRVQLASNVTSLQRGKKP